jgi:DNA-directed RNA polymerase subunit RPC12/RpoP
MKRKTEKDYHKLAESRGFKWVGGVLPKNVCVKSWWECEKGHRWETKYSKIQNGSGCPHCSKKIRKTENSYHILTSKNNFKWLGKYLPKNTKTKTLWGDLSDGRVFELSYSSVLCSSGKVHCSKKLIKTVGDYYKLAMSRGFKWVDKELPRTVMTKTWWGCEKGHKWLAKYNDISCSGSGCPHCAKCAKKIEEDYHSMANKYGFTWIGKELPGNTNIKTQWVCLRCGYVREVTYSSIQQGKGCPYCANRVNGVLVSKQQIRLSYLLCGSLNYPESKYRIDVAIMRNSQKIAVEYDAQYWHKGREQADYKRDKYLISKGWKILHVKANYLIPARKQLTAAIGYLLNTDDKVYSLYLEDWR